MYIPKVIYVSEKRRKQLEKGRNTDRYQQWRKTVLARDNNTCQGSNCCKREKLTVHHIKKWAQYKHLRYNTSNGITLCEECHKKTFGKEENYAVIFLQKVLKNEAAFDAKLNTDN